METVKSIIMKTLISFQDIEVTLSGQTLVIANNKIRRELDLSSGAPRTVSLQDAQGMEFIR